MLGFSVLNIFPLSGDPLFPDRFHLSHATVAKGNALIPKFMAAVVTLSAILPLLK